MLRSPLEILVEHRWSTVGVVFLLAVGLWLAAALSAVALQAHQAGQTWWEKFSPVVYLSAGVDDGLVDEMRREIQEWDEVASVEVQSREQMLAGLTDHLGEERTSEMAIDAQMMPAALVINPPVWSPDQERLIQRLRDLEVRSSVLAVDAPHPEALRWQRAARKLAIGLAVMVLLGLVSILMVMGAFLRRLQELERRENHLLEVFGATKAALRRPTLWRGMTLGLAGGAVGAVAFLPWSHFLDAFVVQLVGAGAFTAIRSGLWAGAVVVAGLLLGAVVGWLSGRRQRPAASGRMESLLDWPRELT